VFNPHWWHKDKEDWKRHVIRILAVNSSRAWCNAVDKLWILDHGLKRTKNAPTIEEMTKEYKFPFGVFYTSGRKLVEVNSWNLTHFEDSNPEALDKEGQPFNNWSVDLAWRLYDTYGRPVSVLGWDDLEG
jgi:hypothetical protein